MNAKQLLRSVVMCPSLMFLGTGHTRPVVQQIIAPARSTCQISSLIRYIATRCRINAQVLMLAMEICLI